MAETTTVVVGAGHCGLAMSRCLADRSIDHVVLERGEVANSWRTQRWDSLRLLTPNWMTRLPGFALPRRRPGRLPDRAAGGAADRGLRRGVRGARAGQHHGDLGPGGRRRVRGADRPGHLARADGGARRRRQRRRQRAARWRGRCLPGSPRSPRRDYRNPGRAARRRGAGGRRLGQRDPDRRRAAPLRAAGHPRRRRARPDAAHLPRPGHPVVDGRRRGCSTSATTRSPTCRGRATCRRCSWSARRSGQRST